MKHQHRAREAELLVWLNSRTIALTLYAIMGIEVGLAIIASGGPSLIEEHWGPWSRLLLGGLALLGGLCTAIGAIRGDRTPSGWWLALVGTSLMAMWALTIGTGYAVATLEDGVTFQPPWVEIEPSFGRLYIPLLYQSLLFLILLHVITLARLGRPSKR